MKCGIIICFSFLCTILYAGDRDMLMEIGLFRDVKVYKLRIAHYSENFSVYGDSNRIGTISTNEQYIFKIASGKTSVYKGNVLLGDYDTVYVRSDMKDAVFKIKPVSPSYRERKYYGGLVLTDESGHLKIINKVPLHHYLAGVIESESGSRQNKEYYKVQAIISRTYALRNREKHLKEGFMLTDLVNCQVYKDRCQYNTVIYDAVAETDGLVIVDEKLEMITAAFYSNSGGQTANSEDVWNKPLSYLKSVKDEWSEGTYNATWKKVIPRWRWLTYLKNTYQYPTGDSLARVQALSFRQDQRKAFFVDPCYGIPLRDIRKDWRLKSAFFSVGEEGDNVILKGKGFGHGVGLSQEGAMAMSKDGMTYREIIMYYYTNVEILSYELLRYFRYDDMVDYVD